MISEQLRLDNQTLLVAGAGGGDIGTAVALAVAELGATVVALDIQQEHLNTVAALVEEQGGSCIPLLVDARDPENINEALASIEHLDGAVNVIGGNRGDAWRRFSDYPAALFDQVLDLNLRCAFNISKASVAKILQKNNTGAETTGSIVNIVSIAGLSALPYAAAYSTAKAGVIAMTQTMAVELGRYGIRANCVAPGTIRTQRSMQQDIDRGIDSSQKGDAAIPLGHRGKPDDIAQAVVFLLSDMASYINGHTLVVDGGLSIKPAYLDEDNLPVFVSDPKLFENLVK